VLIEEEEAEPEEAVSAEAGLESASCVASETGTVNSRVCAARKRLVYRDGVSDALRVTAVIGDGPSGYDCDFDFDSIQNPEFVGRACKMCEMVTKKKDHLQKTSKWV
jgi:hypothetical protein